MSSLTALADILRIAKPDVHYEESQKFKIGKPESFPVGTMKKLEDKKGFTYFPVKTGSTHNLF